MIPIFRYSDEGEGLGLGRGGGGGGGDLNQPPTNFSKFLVLLTD